MSDKLKPALEKLREELRNVEPSGQGMPELHEKVVRAIESGEHLPLIRPLCEAAKAFEASHPDLTALINNVLSSLSDLGI